MPYAVKKHDGLGKVENISTLQEVEQSQEWIRQALEIII